MTIMQAKSVGIHIQSGSISLAVAAVQGGRTKILSLVERQIQTPSDEDPAESPEAVWEAIREALAEVGVGDDRDDQFVASLPAPESVNRLLVSPLTDPAKIRQTLKFQIEPKIPYPIDHVISDFVLVRTLDGASEILAIAAVKDNISERLALLGQAGVAPRVLTVDALALAEFYITPFDFSCDRVTALLLPDSEGCFLGFFAGEKPVGYRSLKGFVEGDEKALEALIRELRRTLIGFQSGSVEEEGVGALCVGGGGEWLRASLQESFRDLSVRSVQFNENSLVEIPPDLQDLAARCRPAIALARAGIDGSGAVNFLREEFAPPSVMARLIPNIKFSIGVLCAVFLLWFAGVWAQIYGHSSRLEALNDEMVGIFSASMPGIESASAAESRIKEEREKFKSLKNYTSEYVSPLEVLREVDAAKPKGKNISLNDLSDSDGVLKIIGVVDSFDDIDVFKKRIEASPLFFDVKIESANKSERAKKVIFRIRADIKSPEKPKDAPDADRGGEGDS